MTAYRVRVRRLGGEWRALLVPPDHTPDSTAVVLVGDYPTMPEAVRRGVTAARFAAVGISVEAAS